MTYYSTSLTGENNVFLFHRRKQRIREAHKEAQIQAIRQDTFERIDTANASMQKLSDLLDDTQLGVTGKIFLATGGDRRGRG